MGFAWVERRGVCVLHILVFQGLTFARQALYHLSQSTSPKLNLCSNVRMGLGDKVAAGSGQTSIGWYCHQCTKFMSSCNH
jgi:hypothetical protein